MRSLPCLQRKRSAFAAWIRLLLVVGGLAALTGSSPVAAGAPEVATLHAGPALLEWTPLRESESIVLAVSDPQGVVRTFQFRAGEAPALSLFDDRGAALPDGTYTWELRATPRLGRAAAPLVQSGTFTLSGGHLVAPDLSEPPEAPGRPDTPRKLGTTTAADQIVPDDLIIDGKGCIGLGCANNEAFGQEALRLKQSVVRLRFQDTTAAANFPGRDWQLTVNDAGSGGADRFSIEDLTAGTTPLTVRGGAPNHSLYIDGVGNVGVGTATPAARFHVPAGEVRLPGGLGGVHGTHFNFAGDGKNYLRGTTILADSGGSVGIGTADPGARLQVEGLSIFHFDDWGNDTVVFRGQKSGPPNNFGEYAIRTFYAGLLFRNTQSGTEMLFVGQGGAVGIGTTSPASKLHVNGGDIRVSGGSFIDDGVTLNAPDYVFEPDYRLMPLPELKAYVAREKRLPNVPSAGEIKQQGLDLSQFQMRLLEKVEELTLYVLEQHEEIAALQERNARLEARLAAVEAVPQQADQR